jgi:hypothetical protein
VLKNRAVKTYWGTGGKIHVFLTSTVDGSVYPCLWLYGPLPPLRCRPIPSLFGIVPAILVGLLNDICFYEMGSLVLCPTPNIEDQTSVFMTPRDRVARYTPRHLVLILVVSYDTHGSHWGYSCSRPPHGKQ